MLKIVDINQRIEFTASCDSDPKTVFILRPLKASEVMALGEASSRVEGAFKLLEASIVEVKNAGEFGSVRDLIEALPIGVVNELTVKVTEINRMNETLAKN